MMSSQVGFGQGSDKFSGAEGQTNSREGLRPRVRQIIGRGFGRGSDKFSGGASAEGQTNSREGLRPRVRQILEQKTETKC